MMTSALMLFRIFAVILTHAVTLYLMSEPKLLRPKHILVWAIALVVTLLLGIVFTFTIGWTPIFLFSYYLITIAYCVIAFFLTSRGPVLKNLFLIMIYFAYFMFSVSLSQYISIIFFDSNQFAMALIRLMISLLYIILLKLKLRRIFIGATSGIDKGWGIMAFFSSIAFFTTSLLSLSSVFMFEERERMFAWLLVLFVLITAAFAVEFQMVKLLNERNRIRQMEAFQNLLESELESEKAFVENARIYRHDMRHHNLVLLEYLEHDDVEGAKDYIREYDISLSQIRPMDWCENKVVNALLRINARRAFSYGISFRGEVRIPEEISLSGPELVALFGNILENAIESSMGCMEAFIFLKVSTDEKRILIDLRNSLLKPVIFDGEFPISGKRGGGTGLKSVKEVISRHNGMMKLSQEDGVFLTRIIIPLSSKIR